MGLKETVEALQGDRDELFKNVGELAGRLKRLEEWRLSRFAGISDGAEKQIHSLLGKVGIIEARLDRAKCDSEAMLAVKCGVIGGHKWFLMPGTSPIRREFTAYPFKCGKCSIEIYFEQSECDIGQIGQLEYFGLIERGKDG